MPYLPTPYEVVEKTFQWLRTNTDFHRGKSLIDLGAGDGRVILHASSIFKIHSIGLEINPELIMSAKSKIKAAKLGKICKIIEADLYNYDIGCFDFIYIFFIPDSQSAFLNILEQMKSNAILIFIKWPFKKKYEKLSLLAKISPLENYPVFFYQKQP